MKKDIYRIQKIINFLRQIWIDHYSDLRFFQFFTLIESEAKKRFKVEDLFYLEDDKLEKFLYEYQVNNVLIVMFPEQWAKKWGLIILDHDGWRDKSFNEAITEKEFFTRAIECTCTGNISSFDKWSCK